MDEAAGHYYANGSQYKLSCAYKSDTDGNDKCLVYNTTREYQADGYRDGSWTIYDNHPIIGWTNLDEQAYSASTLGEVFEIRQTGLAEDFRDDDQAINMVALLRGMDFGETSVRKAIGSVEVNFRSDYAADGTILETAPDMTNVFEEADKFKVTNATVDLNGIGDPAARKIQTISFSIDKRKVTQIQVRISNNVLDEASEVCGVSYRVSGLATNGITQAISTLEQ
jgi:hypothetical protein